MSFISPWSMCRLSRERITELQQQVEDLQRALQSQAAKPDDVSLQYQYRQNPTALI